MLVIIRSSFLYIFLVFALSTCSILRTGDNCTLDYETNTMNGNDSGQKNFYQPKIHIPCGIEELIGGIKCSEASIHKSWYNKARTKFARYHIYGCADTAWAKQKMAYHLMDKYNVSREGSIYLDTVLLLTVIDESKLDRVEGECHSYGNGINPYDEEPNRSYDCWPWANGGFFMPYEYSKKHRSFSIESESREGNYNYRTPMYIVEEKGLEAYSDILLERYGVTLTWDRVDTVTVPVYKYVK